MIDWTDWILWIIYFAFFYLVFWFYKKSKKAPRYRLLTLAFLIKAIGSLAFALVYVYYYKFGDTFEYFKGAKELSRAFYTSPSLYWDILFSDASESFTGQVGAFANSLEYSDTVEEWFMVKLLSPFALISFNSYLVLNLLLSLVSLLGSWKLFTVFEAILPKYRKLAFICAFLIPTVVFWGSGVVKDTVTLAGVNYMIYLLYFAVVKKNVKPSAYFIALLFLIVTFQLKSYIIITFFPGVLLAIYFQFRGSIRSNAVKVVFTPIVFLLLFVTTYFGISYLTQSSSKYKVSQIEGNIRGFHSWHTSVGGSSYSLGVIDYSPVGIASKVPAALNVTFFRPYLWEARNPAVLLSALESLVIFILFIQVLFATKFRPWKYLKGQPLLKGLLLFILVFGFAIGFTSYNFGALARYKIPILSIFVFTLLYLKIATKAVKKLEIESKKD